MSRKAALAISVYHFESTTKAETWSLDQTLLSYLYSTFGFEDAAPYILEFISCVLVEVFTWANASPEEEFWPVSD